MKLYLDMCCLKRPFDDQTQVRIQLETVAIEAILQLCRTGEQQMMTSDALRFENTRNPNPDRRQFADDLLKLAAEDVPHSSDLEERAEIWQNVGMGLLDALHLASAEVAEADRFATCDDVLLQKAPRVIAKVPIVSLLDLFKELTS
jgi:predicted nucleic acid-binding protein